MNSSLNLSNTFQLKYDECLIDIFTNRGSTLIKSAFKQNYFLFKENGIIPGKYIFIYFDNGRLTQNKYKDLIASENVKKNNSIIFKTMSETNTWRIDDKREFSRILKNCEYLPRTYLTIENFRLDIQNYPEKFPENKIWFAKSRGSTSGRGVNAFTTTELKTASISSESIIQEGVENLVLYKKRKFVIRSYILLHDKKSYIYNKFFSPVHGKEYDPCSTEYLTQISHAGYQQDKEGGVRLINCADLFADTPGFEELVFKRMVHASRKMIEFFHDTRNASSKTDYIILGVDNLLFWTNDVNEIDIRFIEINRYPNIVHTPKINKEINQKLFSDTICKLLNIENVLDNGYVQLTN
jgi:hypothetical protein